MTCDTAPHYFALNETAVGEYRTFAKLSPPLRSEADRRAVVEGLRDGTIDAIASDHAPQDQEFEAPALQLGGYGIVGLETLAALVARALSQPPSRLLERAAASDAATRRHSAASGRPA